MMDFVGVLNNVLKKIENEMIIRLIALNHFL